MDNSNSYTYLKYISNKKTIKYVAIFSFIVLLGLLYPAYKASNPWLASILILLILADTLYINKSYNKMWSRNYFTWGKGAGAELKEGTELEKLGSGFYIINDFPTGHGNIDHICIGPSGIFVIETKANSGIISYTDRLLINDKEPEKDYIHQLWAEINYLKNLLKDNLGMELFIEGILEFPNARVDYTIRHKEHGVWIGGKGFANYIIKKELNRLTISPEKIVNLLKNIISINKKSTGNIR